MARLQTFRNTLYIMISRVVAARVSSDSDRKGKKLEKSGCESCLLSGAVEYKAHQPAHIADVAIFVHVCVMYVGVVYVRGVRVWMHVSVSVLVPVCAWYDVCSVSVQPSYLDTQIDMESDDEEDLVFKMR
eukprot:m.504353 g.504353  ORF g.504353 m.504353 type:complete len:130 (-) comp21858_c1_seq3:419-808(-)